MSSRRDVLHEVMLETGTSQSELARLSGVRQSSISQFLSGKVNMSDEQLSRLLACLGFCLEIVRRPVAPELTRSEARSWRLHRQLAIHLTQSSLEGWRPRIERTLARLRGGVTGQPHLRNLDRWESLIERSDVPGLHRVLTGLDRESIEMREVSPMGGLLAQAERADVLRAAS
ncbi:helix-turn-helix domain-containing protein [Nocardia sp. NPDC059177]|uniref:helix-turn-helix domain-containing protein n=1 Tax=Nocardia sp. NPDC059177 TaxID=3346759 RepID=UPI00368E26E6